MVKVLREIGNMGSGKDGKHHGKDVKPKKEKKSNRRQARSSIGRDPLLGYDRIKQNNPESIARTCVQIHETLKDSQKQKLIRLQNKHANEPAKIVRHHDSPERVKQLKSHKSLASVTKGTISDNDPHFHHTQHFHTGSALVSFPKSGPNSGKTSRSNSTNSSRKNSTEGDQPKVELISHNTDDNNKKSINNNNNNNEDIQAEEVEANSSNTISATTMGTSDEDISISIFRNKSIENLIQVSKSQHSLKGSRSNPDVTQVNELLSTTEIVKESNDGLENKTANNSFKNKAKQTTHKKANGLQPRSDDNTAVALSKMKTHAVYSHGGKKLVDENDFGFTAVKMKGDDDNDNKIDRNVQENGEVKKKGNQKGDKKEKQNSLDEEHKGAFERTVTGLLRGLGFGRGKEHQQQTQSKIARPRSQSVDHGTLRSVPQQKGPSGTPAWGFDMMLMDESSKIITLDIVKIVSKHLPSLYKGADWGLTYSTYSHGTSLSTLYRKCNDNVNHEGPTVTLLKLPNNIILGSFTACKWKKERVDRYIRCESFLFRVKEDDLTIFPWNGESDYSMMSTPQGLYLGLDDGKFALYIDENLVCGTTEICSTFNLDEALLNTREFDILGVEVWYIKS